MGKLVRDNIVEIILANGGSCEFSVLNDADYLFELHRKFVEELKEVTEAFNERPLDSLNMVAVTEELADLREVAQAINNSNKDSQWLHIAESLANVWNIHLDIIEKVQLEKRIERGGFNDRIYLISW